MFIITIEIWCLETLPFKFSEKHWRSNCIRWAGRGQTIGRSITFSFLRKAAKKFHEGSHLSHEALQPTCSNMAWCAKLDVRWIGWHNAYRPSAAEAKLLWRLELNSSIYYSLQGTWSQSYNVIKTVSGTETDSIRWSRKMFRKIAKQKSQVAKNHTGLDAICSHLPMRRSICVDRNRCDDEPL